MERISWDAYFIAIAHTVKLRSEDPRTQVGCVIVDEENHIVSTGYNGLPPNYNMSNGAWANRDIKYKNVLHAEINALGHASKPVRGGTLYCTLSPCIHCAQAIVAAGIKRVVYGKKFHIDDGGLEFLYKHLECIYIGGENEG